MPHTNVYDVAAFIQRELGTLSEYKLQKLVYYAQAWSLVWDDQPMFDQVIKAWIDGPVSPELWHRCENGVGGNPDALDTEQQATVRAVLDWYGRFSAEELIELSHREDPWREARRGLAPSEHGQVAITPSEMQAYYGQLSEGAGTHKCIPDSVKRGTTCLLKVPEDRLGDLKDERPVDSASLLAWLRGEADPCHDS